MTKGLFKSITVNLMCEYYKYLVTEIGSRHQNQKDYDYNFKFKTIIKD